MNNLKFRAYFEQYERMIDNIGIINQNMILVDFTNSGELEPIFIMDKIHVMQSTGLKDKNGKEIYEGDVLKVLDFTDWKGEVRYSQEELSYFFVEYENSLRLKYTTLLSLLDKNLEVIGNIYENKELLRKWKKY